MLAWRRELNTFHNGWSGQSWMVLAFLGACVLHCNCESCSWLTPNDLICQFYKTPKLFLVNKVKFPHKCIILKQSFCSSVLGKVLHSSHGGWKGGVGFGLLDENLYYFLLTAISEYWFGFRSTTSTTTFWPLRSHFSCLNIIMPEPRGCPISMHSGGKITLANDLLCRLDIRVSCPDFLEVLSCLKLLSCFETTEQQRWWDGSRQCTDATVFHYSFLTGHRFHKKPKKQQRTQITGIVYTDSVPWIPTVVVSPTAHLWWTWALRLILRK